ncbi:retrovirus-related pol polyprotein from transposon TNT 1-94 [Tanacetum coccineum]
MSLLPGLTTVLPMLDKSNYNSWASCMLLYLEGKDHGKLLVDSVLNGPFQYGTIIEPGNENSPATVRARTYTDLTDEEKLRESIDIKATNIFLLGLPQDIYNLVNHNDKAKQIWDRIKLLIQGLELSLQERKSKLYDDFDIFTSMPGETIHSYYMRNQATIQDGRVTVQTVQRRQSQGNANNEARNNAINHRVNRQGATDQAGVTDDLDAFDSDCDDVPTAKAVLMANLSSYDSDVLSKCSEQLSFDDHTNVDITSDSNIISYEQYFQENENLIVQSTSPPAQQDELLMSVIEEMSSQVAKSRRKVPALYDGHTIVKTHNALTVTDTEETLELAEESRLNMLTKQHDPSLIEKKVNIAPINYVALNKLSEHFVKHFMPQKQLSAEQTFWLPISQPVFEKPLVPSEPVLKKEILRELPTNSLVKDSFHKMKGHVNKFDETITFHTNITGNRIGSWGVEHIEGAFEKDVKPFAQTLKDYFKMSEQGLYKELKEMKAVFNQTETEVAKCSVDKKYFEIEKKELILDSECLLEHIICQDVKNIVMHAKGPNALFVHNNCLDNDNLALESLKMNNDRLMELLISQDLMHTHLAKMNDIVKKAVYNELSNRYKRITSSVRSEGVSIKKLKEHIASLKGKNVVDSVQPVHNSNVVTSTVYKVDLQPLSPCIKNNREAHVNYLKITQEHIDTLRGIVEHARALIPFDNALDYACKYTQRIQELLVYVCRPNHLMVHDSGCSKHMIRHRSQLINFVSKFLGTVRFGNDQVAKIMGYDLEVAFWKHTCYVRNLDDVDLLSGSRDTNLYTISLDDMLKSSPISKQGLVRGLLKLNFNKDHLCSTCSLGKSKKASHKPTAVDTNQEKLYLLHMDLCGPMRVESINGKKYILVIVDDYSRFTWVKFLRSKDEAP